MRLIVPGVAHLEHIHIHIHIHPHTRLAMAPPTAPLNLDVEAISGICGYVPASQDPRPAAVANISSPPPPRSISIACWVVVFSPQIIENFRRGSADGLSLQFVIVWLLGDVFNILGAIFQGVLPTMLILAVYYTIADVVLLGQCFYYRGFTWRDEVVPPSDQHRRRRRRSRTSANGISNGNGTTNGHTNGSASAAPGAAADEHTSLLAHPTDRSHRDRRGSDWSDRLTHLNPVLPMVEPSTTPPPPSTNLQRIAWNALAVLMVIAAGVVGWLLSRTYGPPPPSDQDGDGRDDEIRFDLWGQIFGWLCAVLYLGSRLPQLLLNWRRKSTEGVSMLFFLFACLGNLTYVLSIVAFDPRCYDDAVACQPGEAGRVYGQYILVNLSWLAGSFGTLLLDMGIFVQFFIYRKENEDDVDSVIEEEEEDEGRSIDGDRWDQRPILERNQSEWSA